MGDSWLLVCRNCLVPVVVDGYDAAELGDRQCPVCLQRGYDSVHDLAS